MHLNNNVLIVFIHTELVEEKGGGEGGRLVLTFHLPLSPLLKLHPVLALASSVPMTTSDMEVSFTSPALQPPTQVRLRPSPRPRPQAREVVVLTLNVSVSPRRCVCHRRPSTWF